MADSPSRSRAGYLTHTTRVVYANAWLSFVADAITHPGGVPGEHGVVVTPDASAVVAIDGRDVLLTRQPRYAIDAVVLEVVKGGRHAGEDGLACAQRELREEVGMAAARWDALGEAYEIPSIVRAPVTLYLARDLQAAHAEAEAVESIDAVRLPFDVALAMCADGRIRDAITTTALLRASRLLAPRR